MIRYTEKNRKMTGACSKNSPEIALGWREDGSPGVTIHAGYSKGYACYKDPELLEKFQFELHAAIRHLRGEDVGIDF